MFVASLGVYSMKNPCGAGVSESGGSIVLSSLSDILSLWVRSMRGVFPCPHSVNSPNYLQTHLITNLWIPLYHLGGVSLKELQLIT